MGSGESTRGGKERTLGAVGGGGQGHSAQQLFFFCARRLMHCSLSRHRLIFCTSPTAGCRMVRGQRPMRGLYHTVRNHCKAPPPLLFSPPTKPAHPLRCGRRGNRNTVRTWPDGRRNPSRSANPSTKGKGGFERVVGGADPSWDPKAFLSLGPSCPVDFFAGRHCCRTTTSHDDCVMGSECLGPFPSVFVAWG